MTASSATATVSVIVATNRLSPYLTEALASIRAQTFGAVETILVDDGSPDPQAMSDLVGDSVSRLIRTAPAGVSAARNRGVQTSSGAYLAFLDDDDRWHPDRLARQVAELGKAPSAVAGYCGLRSIDEAGAEIAPADQIAIRDRYDIARRRTGILMPNLVVRRAAWEAVGGLDEGLRLAEDLDLVLRLAALGPFVFTSGALVDYRQHSANTTGRHQSLAGAIEDVLHAHLSRAQSADDIQLARAYSDSLRANDRYAWWAALRAARRLAKAGRFAAAGAEVGWAIRFAPLAPLDALGRRLRRRP